MTYPWTCLARSHAVQQAPTTRTYSPSITALPFLLVMWLLAHLPTLTKSPFLVSGRVYSLMLPLLSLPTPLVGQASLRV
jgi:hypothetical protein